MEEPEKICDRVGIVFAGRLIQVGSPSELKDKVSELSVIEVETPGLSKVQVQKIRDFGEVCNVTYTDPVLRIRCVHDHGHELTEKVTKILLSEEARIRSINTKGPTLEEAFIALTGGEKEIDRFMEKSQSKR